MLVLRRARVQWRLLAAVVVLVATACTLVGTCTLVLDVTQSRGFEREVLRTEPADLGVTAFLVDLGSDAPAARDEAARVVADVLAPMRATQETTITSRLRDLDEDGARTGSQAYLVATDALARRADLTAGRWPSPSGARPEIAVPDTAARLLGLRPGDVMRLGAERGSGGTDQPMALVVVGTFRPRALPEWERDPLGGAGFAASYSDGLEPAPTYGPLVIDAHDLLDSGSSINAVRVTAYPTLDLADHHSLQRAADLLVDASGRLSARVGDRARLTRVASDLPRTLAHLEAQQASTGATVLVVLLLGVALSLAAALLAGRLVGSVREDEAELLTAMGRGRRQLVGGAAAEAALLATLAAAVAVPAAALLHSRLTHRRELVAAGLEHGPVVTGLLVLAVVGTAVLLAGTLVAAAARPRPVADPSPRAGLTRRGVDVVLAVAAALAWWQLRTQRPGSTGSGSAGDAVLTVAPVLCLAALTVLGVRLVVAFLQGAATTSGRSRGLLLPLATQGAAQRARASTALVLVVAAVATAVFALAVHATWSRSQRDQAALRVGTDLALTLRAPAGLREAREVGAVLTARTGVGSPVVHRPLALGRYIGEPGSRPVLVAVDSRRAGALLRGRVGAGQTWYAVGRELAPPAAPSGLALPDDGVGVTMRGRGPARSSLTAQVTAVVEDPTGFRAAVPAGNIPLDGVAHPLEWSAPLGADLELVAVRLEVDGSSGATPSAVPVTSTVRVTVSIPTVPAVPDVPVADADQQDDATAPSGPTSATGPWQVRPLQEQGPVGAATARLRTTDAGTELRTRTEVDLAYIDYTGADVLATVLPDPALVPVAASADLVGAVGASVGDELSAVVGGATLRLQVVTVVPAVPSAPGEVAVLADLDALSRALVHTGRLEPVVDGWWVGAPARDTGAALGAAGLGTVTTRPGTAADLARGPLRVAAPTTLLLLLGLSAALFLAAVVLTVGADRPGRSAGIARLRALGVSRRDAVRHELAEHLVLLLPPALVGTCVGAASSVLVGPLLVRSDVGAAPVPTPVVAWPWAAELAVVGALVLGSALLSWALGARLVRASTPSRVREGGS